MDAGTLQNLQTLDPKFRPIALRAVDEAQKAMPTGVRIVVIEGYRSIAESNRLSAEARTGPRAVPGGKSYHNYGLAFDIEMYASGRQITRVDANWLKVVSIMKKYGMAWGGDFRSNYDPGHFEMSFGQSWQGLLAQYTPGKPANKLLIAGLIIAALLIYWIV
jgi:peptidoglycan L-alanyl-D-glutamate endopeptidase CwlK